MVAELYVNMKNKAAELRQTLPILKAEQERISLEKARDEAANKAEQDKLNADKAKEETTRKAKLVKTEIDVNDFISKIAEFKTIINAIKHLPRYPTTK